MKEYWWIGLIITPSLAVLIAVLTWGFRAASWKGKVDEFMTRTKKFMETTEEKLNSIIFHISKDKTMTSSSPLRLTDLGQTISTEVGVREWAKDHAPKFLPNVKNLSKEFEIYEFCKQYFAEDFSPSEELESRMKEVAYQHGMELPPIIDVFVLELRDELLRLTQINA